MTDVIAAAGRCPTQGSSWDGASLPSFHIFTELAELARLDRTAVAACKRMAFGNHRF